MGNRRLILDPDDNEDDNDNEEEKGEEEKEEEEETEVQELVGKDGFGVGDKRSKALRKEGKDTANGKRNNKKSRKEELLSELDDHIESSSPNFKRLKRKQSNRGGEGEHSRESEDKQMKKPKSRVEKGAVKKPKKDAFYVEDSDSSEEDDMADFIVYDDCETTNLPPMRRKSNIDPWKSSPSFNSSDKAGKDHQPMRRKEKAPLRKPSMYKAQKDCESKATQSKNDQFSSGATSEEPSILERIYLNSKVDVICNTDIPERLQIIDGDIGFLPPKETKIIESEWIYNMAFSCSMSLKQMGLEHLQNVDKGELIQEINFVLTQLHHGKLEIPFVAMYRKHGCMNLVDEKVTELNGAEFQHETKACLKHFQALWAVHSWDKKWRLLERRKEKLTKLCEKLCKENATGDKYKLIFQDIQGAESDQELDDAHAKINLLFDVNERVVVQEQFKRPKQQTFYSICQKAGLEKVSKMFGLTPVQFGENLKEGYKKHSVNDIALTPEEFVEKSNFRGFKDPCSILKGARHLAAMGLSTEPCVRKFVRSVYLEKAVVTTKPTVEGNSVIGLFHEYASIKWLFEKPLNAFNDGQWLLIQKAEEKKLLKVTLAIPDAVLDDSLIKKFENVYLSDNDSPVTCLWNEQRIQVIRDSLLNYILPVVEKGARITLTSGAKNWISSKYRNRIWKMGSVAPYRLTREGLEGKMDHIRAPRVLACCMGAGKTPTTFVMIDDSGDIIDILETCYLNIRVTTEEHMQRKEEDEKRFLNFLAENKPHVVVLGAANVYCRFLKDAISNLISRCAELFPDSGKGGLEDMIQVVYGDEALAGIYETSQVSIRHAHAYQGIVRRAVGLGRYLQNPLALVSSLCGQGKEIISLKLHEMQSFLTEDELYGAVEQVMVTLTNQIGVDINFAASHEWLFSPLQFVSGLGPRKASFIWNCIQHIGCILSRSDMLKSLGLMKENVYINSSAFMRIRGAKQVGVEEVQNFDPLDDTRIHPHSYEIAINMAKYVYIDSGYGDQKSSQEQMLERALKFVKQNPDKLENLDVAMYASIVEEMNGFDKLDTLNNIRKEFLYPFHDLREPYALPSQEEEIFLLTGENDESLPEGKIVNASISRITEERVLCTLSSGLLGVIQLESLPVEQKISFLDKVSIGSIITCCVNIFKKAKFLAELTWIGNDMQSDYYQNQCFKDPYYKPEEPLVDSVKEISRKERENKICNIFKPRTISHPLFKNISMSEAVKELAGKEVGKLIIRPSTKGPCFLAMTIKAYTTGVCIHIDILEIGKDCSDITSFLRIGKKLKAGGVTYEDLDAVVAGFAKPLVENMKAILAHNKFKAGEKAQLADYLREEQKTNPTQAAFCFSVSDEHSEAFSLCYLRENNVHRDCLDLHPKGFKYDQKMFAKLDDVVHYFKKHTGLEILRLEEIGDRMRRGDLNSSHSYGVGEWNERGRGRGRGRERGRGRGRGRGRNFSSEWNSEDGYVKNHSGQETDTGYQGFSSGGTNAWGSSSYKDQREEGITKGHWDSDSKLVTANDGWGNRNEVGNNSSSQVVSREEGGEGWSFSEENNKMDTWGQSSFKRVPASIQTKGKESSFANGIDGKQESGWGNASEVTIDDGWGIQPVSNDSKDSFIVDKEAIPWGPPDPKPDQSDAVIETKAKSGMEFPINTDECARNGNLKDNIGSKEETGFDKLNKDIHIDPQSNNGNQSSSGHGSWGTFEPEEREALVDNGWNPSSMPGGENLEEGKKGWGKGGNTINASWGSSQSAQRTDSSREIDDCNKDDGWGNFNKEPHEKAGKWDSVEYGKSWGDTGKTQNQPYRKFDQVDNREGFRGRGRGRSGFHRDGGMGGNTTKAFWGSSQSPQIVDSSREISDCNKDDGWGNLNKGPHEEGGKSDLIEYGKSWGDTGKTQSQPYREFDQVGDREGFRRRGGGRAGFHRDGGMGGNTTKAFWGSSQSAEIADSSREISDCNEDDGWGSLNKGAQEEASREISDSNKDDGWGNLNKGPHEEAGKSDLIEYGKSWGDTGKTQSQPYREFDQVGNREGFRRRGGGRAGFHRDGGMGGNTTKAFWGSSQSAEIAEGSREINDCNEDDGWGSLNKGAQEEASKSDSVEYRKAWDSMSKSQSQPYREFDQVDNHKGFRGRGRGRAGFCRDGVMGGNTTEAFWGSSQSAQIADSSREISDCNKDDGWGSLNKGPHDEAGKSDLVDDGWGSVNKGPHDEAGKSGWVEYGKSWDDMGKSQSQPYREFDQLGNREGFQRRGRGRAGFHRDGGENGYCSQRGGSSCRWNSGTKELPQEGDSSKGNRWGNRNSGNEDGGSFWGNRESDRSDQIQSSDYSNGRFERKGRFGRGRFDRGGRGWSRSRDDIPPPCSLTQMDENAEVPKSYASGSTQKEEENGGDIGWGNASTTNAWASSDIDKGVGWTDNSMKDQQLGWGDPVIGNTWNPKGPEVGDVETAKDENIENQEGGRSDKTRRRNANTTNAWASLDTEKGVEWADNSMKDQQLGWGNSMIGNVWDPKGLEAGDGETKAKNENTESQEVGITNQAVESILDTCQLDPGSKLSKDIACGPSQDEQTNIEILEDTNKGGGWVNGSSAEDDTNIRDEGLKAHGSFGTKSIDESTNRLTDSAADVNIWNPKGFEVEETSVGDGETEAKAEDIEIQEGGRSDQTVGSISHTFESDPGSKLSMDIPSQGEQTNIQIRKDTDKGSGWVDRSSAEESNERDEGLKVQGSFGTKNIDESINRLSGSKVDGNLWNREGFEVKERSVGDGETEAKDENIENQEGAKGDETLEIILDSCQSDIGSKLSMIIACGPSQGEQTDIEIPEDTNEAGGWVNGLSAEDDTNERDEGLKVHGSFGTKNIDGSTDKLSDLTADIVWGSSKIEEIMDIDSVEINDSINRDKNTDVENVSSPLQTEGRAEFQTVSIGQEEISHSEERGESSKTYCEVNESNPGDVRWTDSTTNSVWVSTDLIEKKKEVVDGQVAEVDESIEENQFGTWISAIAHAHDDAYQHSQLEEFIDCPLIDCYQSADINGLNKEKIEDEKSAEDPN